MDVAVGITWFDELASRPDILAAADFIEVAGWQLSPTFTRPHERIILHNLDQDWSMAHRDAVGADWPARLQAAIAQSETPWFSLHLGFAAEFVRFENHMLPASAPLERDALLERIVTNATRARELCPLPLLLENLDYCPEGAYEHVCDPDFISEVLVRTGAGLLFDIGHWQVSASWLGYDAIETLDRIPIERAIEVHVSSPRPLDAASGRLDDAHEVLTTRDLELLEVVLERASPRAITLEYQRDFDHLTAQIEQLRTLLGARAGIPADLWR